MKKVRVEDAVGMELCHDITEMKDGFKGAAFKRGHVIREEDIPHLFERFYKGKDTREKGIGIGLSLARSIFEMQNGNITARNMPEGGACFEIRVYSH